MPPQSREAQSYCKAPVIGPHRKVYAYVGFVRREVSQDFWSAPSYKPLYMPELDMGRRWRGHLLESEFLRISFRSFGQVYPHSEQKPLPFRFIVILERRSGM